MVVSRLDHRIYYFVLIRKNALFKSFIFNTKIVTLSPNSVSMMLLLCICSRPTSFSQTAAGTHNKYFYHTFAASQEPLLFCS